MNIRYVRRIVSLLALTAMLAVGLAAHADAPPNIYKVAPVAGAVASAASDLVWTNFVTPQKYTLKFTIAASGEVVKYNVPLANCVDVGVCTVAISDTGVLDHVEDGWIVHWRVTAKYGAQTSKSSVWSFVADTVNAPDGLLPANGANLHAGYHLSWNNDSANASYTLIVRNVATGERVIKSKLFSGTCSGICLMNPFNLAGLAHNQDYRWFVKAKGYNGDTAKSVKHTFTAILAEAAS